MSRHRHHREKRSSNKDSSDDENGNQQETSSKHSKREHRHKRRGRSNRKPGVWGGLLTYFLMLMQLLIDRVLELVLGFVYGEKKVCPAPSANSEIIQKSGVDLARLIKERKLTSQQVVKAYIERIKETNSFLNAMVDGPYAEALQEAEALDKRIEAGDVSEEEFKAKPFLGVPFTTKESTAVGGKRHTLGLLSRTDSKAKEDAECIRLVKTAGGIMIGISNVPEVNKWIETRNMVYGQTNNPYDSRRTVGGSSGGEGALISACATGFGVGTDIGGSIRIPAFCCGVYGHKPTEGVINTKGCTFRTGKEKSTMVVAGPMSRHVEDLLPLMKVLVEPEKYSLLKLDEKPDIKKFKYFFITENGSIISTPVNKELKDVMKKVTSHLSDLTGEECTKANLPGIEKSKNLWRYWMSQEPANFLELMGNGEPVNPIVELIKKLVGLGNFSISGIFGLVDSILPAENARKMIELTKKLQEAFDELLGDDGILLYTSSPRTAAFHYHPLFLKFHDFHYFSIFNVLRAPCTQVPMGLDSNGLPLGIQVVATKNRDRDCIAVAEELGRTFGGWVPPFRQ